MAQRMALKVVAQSIVQRAINNHGSIYDHYYVYGNDKQGWYLANVGHFNMYKEIIAAKFNPLEVESYDRETKKWTPVEKT